MKRTFARGAALAVAMAAAASATAGEVRVDPEKFTLGVMYAPFCRTEYVGTNVWERDIRQIAELGYTCLHGFSEWWRVERKEGEFDFSETDLLVSLCHKYGVTPIINVCTANGFSFYPPRWFQRLYNAKGGDGMVDSDGDGIPVRTQNVAPCLDDPLYLKYAERYLAALGRHYAGDKRVGGWVIWGEPSLSKNGKAICYCEHTLRRFREYLKGKYGTIDALNREWGYEGPSDWLSFDEVLPPTGSFAKQGSYESWTDFMDFMSANFAGHIRNAGDIMKRSGATQPTINEIFCSVQTWDLSNDHWKLAEASDVLGISLYPRSGTPSELSITVADSIARRLGHSVFAVEVPGGPKFFSWGGQSTASVDELKTIAIQNAGLGVRGAMYWCYRPRMTDFEGGTFGLCRADGRPLPRAHATGSMAAELAKLGRRLADADRRPEVAVLYQTDVHFAKSDKTAEARCDAIVGALRLCFDAHVTPRLVSSEMIERGLPRELKVLILPFAYVLDEATAKGVAEFVRAGGTVVADYAVGFKRRNGYVYGELPGAGLREVFGVVKDEPIVMEHESLLPEDNRYAVVKSSPERPSQMDVLVPTTAKVLEMSRKRPFVTVNSFGKGRAVYLAWEAFDNYRRNEGNAAFRARMLEFMLEAGVKPFVSLGAADELAKPDVCTSALYRGDARIITFVNPSYEAKRLEATVPRASSAEKLVGDVEPRFEAKDGGLAVAAEMAPWQSFMIEVK